MGLFRGMTLDSYLAQIFGNAADPTKGRQMPCHPCDKATNYVVMSSCVSTQIPARRRRGDGDEDPRPRRPLRVRLHGRRRHERGRLPRRDHFAGVTRAPVVLICQNNQWAISTPGKTQTAADTIALKALGYGLPPMRVDGNDVLAVYDACSRAASRARAGGGPTFMELLTYRVSAHSSSDDPSRYRDESVTDIWKSKKDPLRRMRTLLEHRGWLAPGESDELAASIEARVRESITKQEQIPPPPKSSLFDDVFESRTWLLDEQSRTL